MTISFLSARRAITFLNLLLAAALILCIMLLARGVIKHSLGGKAKSAKAADAKKTLGGRKAAAPLESYAPLVERNAFGLPPGRLVPLSAYGVDAEESASAGTALDIVLSGTIAWQNGKGYAVVSDRSGIQEIYKTGEDIPGAGRLVRVRPDRIEIDTGTGTEEVGLSEPSASSAQAAPKSGSQAGSPSANGFARRTSENTYILNQSEVESSLENPKRMLTDARLLPNIVDGAQKGFIMSEVRQDGLYKTLGLQNGDVLFRVNGFDISDTETGLKAFTALKGMDRIELDIMRGGSNMTLTYLVR